MYVFALGPRECFQDSVFDGSWPAERDHVISLHKSVDFICVFLLSKDTKRARGTRWSSSPCNSASEVRKESLLI